MLMRFNKLGLKPLMNVRALSSAEPAIKDKPKRAPNGHKRPCLVEHQARNAALEAAAAEKKLDWRLMGATILQRYPVILPEPEQWEKDMYEVQDKNNARRREYMVSLLENTPGHLFPTKNPSYDEILASMPFQPASRITEADEKNDRHSTERRLADSLYLIVKRNRSTHSWQFPQGKWLPEESMRQTAERVGDRAVGRVNRWYVGNAPAGHFQYEYPGDVQTKRNNFGAKTFYYRAKLVEGNIKLETKLYKDFAWIARDEFDEYFDPEFAKFAKIVCPP